MTSEEGQGTGGLVQQASNGTLKKKKKQCSEALWRMQSLAGNGSGFWEGVMGQVKGVQASNGRCGVWPRVADRFMNGIKEGRSLERLQDKESVLTS